MIPDPERVRRAAKAIRAFSVMRCHDDDVVAETLEASGYPADLDRALDALDAVAFNVNYTENVAAARAVLTELRP